MTREQVELTLVGLAIMAVAVVVLMVLGCAHQPPRESWPARDGAGRPVTCRLELNGPQCSRDSQ